MRPLSIPTMTDRAMQTLYKFALEPLVETYADPNSYGFRKGRCTQDAITHCHMSLAGANAPAWILEGDIKGCFDNISHEWIIEKTPMDKEILRKFLKCGYVDMGKLFKSQAGAPQGGSLSPTICVYVLSGLEKQLKSKLHACKKDGKFYNPKTESSTIQRLILRDMPMTSL
jgi:RNA-directed DNA polymerase